MELIEMLRQTDQILDAQPRLTRLNGGISSEIYLVEDDTERFLVKSAPQY